MKTINYSLLTLLVLLLCGTNLQAQVRIGGSLTPNANAILDLNPDNSDNASKGLLLPRVQLIETSNPAPLTTHTKGMYVFNTVTQNDVEANTAYYNDGTKWQKVVSESSILNLIKSDSVKVKILEIELDSIIGTQSKIFFGTTTVNTETIEVVGIEPIFTGNRVMRLTKLKIHASAELNVAKTAIDWSVSINNDNITTADTCTLHKVLISYICKNDITNDTTGSYSIAGR